MGLKVLCVYLSSTTDKKNLNLEILFQFYCFIDTFPD